MKKTIMILAVAFGIAAMLAYAEDGADLGKIDISTKIYNKAEVDQRMESKVNQSDFNTATNNINAVLTNKVSLSDASLFLKTPISDLAGWSFLEYNRVLQQYKWEDATQVCWRYTHTNDFVVLYAVTNIDLTAIANVEALRAIEDSFVNPPTPEPEPEPEPEEGE